MAIAKLAVKIDANIINPRAGSPAIRETITVKDTIADCLLTNLYHDPYAGDVMCAPIQMNTDWRTSTDVARWGKSVWTLTPSHWDEVARDVDAFLLSDGTDERIHTNEVFTKNTGFLLQFTLLGEKDEYFEALVLEFGQWRLHIYSNGFCKLQDTTDADRLFGWVSSGSRDSLCGGMRELIIMPLGRKLSVRQNGVAGWVYELPETEWNSGLGNAIDAGEFAVTAPNSAVRFQLTRLEYDTDLEGITYEYLSPVLEFPRAPTSDQVRHLGHRADVTGGGGVGTFLKDETGAADFVADGTKTKYRILSVFAPLETSSPFVWAWEVWFDPESPALPDDPGDIVADVRSCSLSVDGRPENTEAHVIVRNPGDYAFYGACNRFAQLKLGDYVLLSGMLKEPPRFVYDEGGDQYYDLTIQGLAKSLQNGNLQSTAIFDNIAHTEVFRWLCLWGGLSDLDIYYDPDATPLRDTRQSAQGGGGKSQLQPKPGDSPIEWIDRLCEQTGWTFTDGHDGNAYILRYIDPLNLPITYDHEFVLKSDLEALTPGGDYSYQRLYKWHAYSLEPEANEVMAVGCDKTGQPIAAIYRDSDSQDPTIAIGSRPANWLGITKTGVMETTGTIEISELATIAYRVGKCVSSRLDMADFEADWPAEKLWVGKVVWIGVPEGETIDGLPGLYRIESLRGEFSYEAGDTPIRRAAYTARKID
jgi:hypothetical protein